VFQTSSPSLPRSADISFSSRLVLLRVLVTIDGVWIGFISPYSLTTLRDYRQFSSVAVLHTFKFTNTHILGFSVFTSRILATDLSQSHCNFISYMKPSFHNLIPFLPFVLNHPRLPSPELDPILSLAEQSRAEQKLTAGNQPARSLLATKREPRALEYNWATLFLGHINTGTWPSRSGESRI
jgi:hypothetical protein